MSGSDDERERLAAGLRRLLGVDVEFEKLSVEELRRLHVVLTNLRRLAVIGAQAIRSRLRSRVNAMLNMRLGDLMSDEGLLVELSRDDGPLGLGILPALIGREDKPKRYRRARRARPASGKEAPGAQGEAEEHPDHG
ncbi:MAG: hypothetical protein RXR82_00400 [Nitrososphaeria archaeon]